jgi:broad specificity phosphatase PhoE
MAALHLVRHGRPLIDRSRPAHEWPLDPAYADDVRALRPRLPAGALWFSSPEPKAIGTAALLTEDDVPVVGDLRELLRDNADWIEDFELVVRRCFAHPDRPAYDGWEPLVDCERRVTGAVRTLVAEHPDRALVLVGHGTAWTVLVASLTGERPDLDRWAALAMPDLIEVVPPGGVDL